MTALDRTFLTRNLLTPNGIRPAAVGVRAGVIVSVRPYDDPPAATDLVRVADDEVLMPGLVDSHVHVNEPGRTQWEGFSSATRAAAAGGVTTILDMPLNSLPPTVDAAALRAKRNAAQGKCHVDVGFWGGAVPGNRNDLAELHRDGVFGMKCFLLDSGVPEFAPLDLAGLRDTLAVLARLDALLIVHAEDAQTIDSSPAPQGRSYVDFLRSRPDVAEMRAIDSVIEAARGTNARAHIVHLSSAQALGALAAARRDGVRISVETCPHYLCISAEQVPDGATQFKCCPPIREAANRDRLWQGLADSLIDAVVSDHSPCTAELKALGEGDFALAWGGIASLQLGLPAIWTAARARGHSLGDVARWMCAGPARIAGLRRKGSIAAGFDADLVAFAPDEQFVVQASRLHHKNAVTPYDGATLTGVVRRTWLRGEPVDFVTARGRLLARGEA